jgi:glycosyltransferase involved in cell wall biosynthesis
MAMKKILLVTRPITPPWDEASKNFAYYLARNISTCAIGLLTVGSVANLPSTVQQYPIYTASHLSWFQRAKLLKLVGIKNDFDILHFMLTPNKLNAFSFKTFLKSKKAKTIQTIATLREDLYSDTDLKEILFGDLIITYSDYAKNKLQALGFKNIQRVYPGIDLEYYSPAVKNLAALEKIGATESDFIVTYPGEYLRLGATDDIVNTIIESANAWKENNIKFVFACRLKNDPTAIQKKAEVIDKLTIEGCLDRAIFTDTVADMATLFNFSDVVIFPVQNMKGKFDVPLAAIEPMACEKPVIVSDLPILKEFANEKNSLTIERGNSEQLTKAILELYQNPDKRKNLGQGGRRFCEENFDIKKVASMYEEIYKQL